MAYTICAGVPYIPAGRNASNFIIFQLMKNKVLDTRWVQEVLILVASFILISLNGWRGIQNAETALQAIVYFGILYTHVTLHRFYLLPLLFKKRYILYSVYGVLLILIFSSLLYVTGVYWVYKWVGMLKQTRLEIYLYHIGTCTLSLIAILGSFILLHFYREQKKEATLQLSLNEMELKLLHSQLNPHFLFNTFNNLYSVSLHDPGRVPEFIMEVSKLMRYHIESYNREQVALEEELSFIESYIVLEEERVGDNCDVKYNYVSDDTGNHSLLPPLLLIPFIENAFKHSATMQGKYFVHINITVQNGTLYMEVINSIPKTKNSFAKSTGLGLKNIKQRLDLLYADKCRLAIQTGPGQFTVNLQLPLAGSPYISPRSHAIAYK